MALRTVIGLAWFAACACRINLMTAASHKRVRIAIAAFGTGGLFYAAAPWVSMPYHVLFVTLAGASVVGSQWVTAALWRRGVPSQFGGPSSIVPLDPPCPPDTPSRPAT